MDKSLTKLSVMVAVLAWNAGIRTNAQEITQEDIVLESLPEDVMATMEARDQWFASLPRNNVGLEFYVEDLLRWTPGATVRVAFLGGTANLHQQIAEAAKPINDNCNIKLDFGHNPAMGTYRQWTTNDTSYVADIRVSFDQGGYFSLVGRDSINPNIGSPSGAVGGRPNQRSLNLGGYHVQLPPEWARTVRHEFLHALAFHHEHQSPTGGCDAHFRWENDPGYVPTQDANGRFVNDANGRRPGIYTYLSGFPNYWSRAKVDHNLRQRPALPGTTAGPFDRASIMLYRFPALFYISTPSPCSPSGGSEELSAGDISGLKYLYPTTESAIQMISERSKKLQKSIAESSQLSTGEKEEVLQTIEGVQYKK